MICWSTAALAQVVDPHVTQRSILPIYGYLNRVQSSRRPEREAWRNVEVLWPPARLASRPIVSLRTPPTGRQGLSTGSSMRTTSCSMSEREDGALSRSDFTFDNNRNVYECR